MKTLNKWNKPDKYYEGPRIVKFIGTGSWMVVARAWGKEGMGCYCSVGTVLVWKGEKVLDGGDGCPQMGIPVYSMPLNCALKTS